MLSTYTRKIYWNPRDKSPYFIIQITFVSTKIPSSQGCNSCTTNVYKNCRAPQQALMECGREGRREEEGLWLLRTLHPRRRQPPSRAVVPSSFPSFVDRFLARPKAVTVVCLVIEAIREHPTADPKSDWNQGVYDPAVF